MTHYIARGVTTVYSTGDRVECHAASGFTVRAFSGKPAKNGIAPRDRQRDMILAFWVAQGVARYNKRAGGVWEARDLMHDGSAWMPLAGQGDAGRSDVIELSHVRSAHNGGAWCACNLIPENGAVNAARGDADMRDLNPAARALLAAWPAWWRENAARPASLARL